MDDLLKRARAEAVVPRVLRPPEEPPQSAPAALHPEAAAALEAQLLRRGDVSTVLPEWDRFTTTKLRLHFGGDKTAFAQKTLTRTYRWER